MNGHLSLEQKMSRCRKLFHKSLTAFQDFSNMLHQLQRKQDEHGSITEAELRNFLRLEQKVKSLRRSSNAATRAFCGKNGTVGVKFWMFNEDYNHVQ